jgi:SAM-dependent methyltransferase
LTDRSQACPSCGCSQIEQRPALIAPFIARYVLDSEPEVCALCRCGDCGLVYFGRPYSEAEIARLYADYRGERYLAIRHSFEPWYTRRFNEDIGGPAGMAPRRRVYQATLAACPDSGTVDTVLDYAGDRGQMMEGGPGRAHFVFEISGAPPETGVTAIADPASLEGRAFDLVLLCGVVEHFSWPLDQVKAAAQHVRPGGLLYVEVPDETFSIATIPQGGWYVRYLQILVGWPLIRLAVDFWSTAMRVKLRTIPPLGFVKQHEHLNFFDVRSLSRLLEAAELTLLSCAAVEGAVVALCRRPA